jgi:cyclophilin family peptidyl-prolyl cis-trans isomerase
MVKHKAPTQITIAPLGERNAFQEFVAKSWKPAVLVAVAATGLIVYSHLKSAKERETIDGRWNDLLASIDLEALSASSPLPAPSELAPMVSQLDGSDVAPWGRVIEARSLLQAREYDRATASLEKLKSEFANHSLINKSFRCSGGTTELIDEVEARVLTNEAWDKKHPVLNGPPDLPSDAPRVQFDTSRGPIVLGLYSDRAPKHVENFLKLCQEGYYNGTRFHRVLKDLLIQGGDPNTMELDSRTWGSGGPDYTLPAEVTDAWHFKGMLAAAAKPGETASSGSQFYITASEAHQFDKQYTVFGRVLEGEDIVETMAREASEQTDRPSDPVVLEAAKVLQ